MFRIGAQAIAVVILITGCGAMDPPCPEFDGSWSNQPPACLLSSNDPALSDTDREVVEEMNGLITSISESMRWSTTTVQGASIKVQETISDKHGLHADHLMILREIREYTHLFGGSPENVVTSVSEVLVSARSDQMTPATD